MDKRPERSYITKDTLEKTVCPRYRVRCRQLGTLTPYQIYLLHRKTMQKYKRYYRLKGKRLRNTDEVPPRSTEKEFLSKTKKFNKRLGENPSDIRLWLEYVKLQDNFYLKTTKMQRAERKMDILNKAIMENLGNEELYREYIRIIKRNFPTFEVSKILDGLLEKGIFCCFFLVKIRCYENSNPNISFFLYRSHKLRFMECSNIINPGISGALYCARRIENI